MLNFLAPFKIYIMIAAILAAGYLGWTSHSWYADSVTLASNKQVEKITKEFRTHESNVASTLEAKLKELKANERVIEREKLKIIDHPVYSNECLDNAGVLLLNSQRGKQNSDSGKSTD